ncbi:MAG: UDP-N-acetylmuramoyl-tripeptide--D-alanyl-D-alanine ligase [Bdellovibrionaceae bacterium]|nr:UDP-N-acetylmuramoyl-tripeptide--D-alanyl-D-alanine ligase [Pseudobdellovibrionaceae bacterium]
MDKTNKKFFVKEVALWSKAKILKHDAQGFSNFLTDTRQYKQDSAFVSLQGKVDANAFLKIAYEKGVRVFFIDQKISKKFLTEIMSFNDVSVLQVPDTLKALQLMAVQWRKSLKGKLVAISGSNGKTSTKNFTYQLLHKYKKTYKSPLSFNNNLGVSLSLLEAEPDDEVILLEMGMSHKGELKLLTQMVKPDIVLVTQVNASHIGHFNSLQEVADAKQELYQFSSDTAVGIFNENNDFTVKMKQKYLAGGDKHSFSFGSEKILSHKKSLHQCVVTQFIEESLFGLRFTLSYFNNGKKQYQNQISVPLLGVHNMDNIAAAVTINLALGVPWDNIIKALNTLQAGWGRMQLLHHCTGAAIIFDAYNANPASFTSALNSLEKFSCAGKKIAVIGAMGELGKWSDEEHYRLALRVGALFDTIGFVGNEDSFLSGLEKSLFTGNWVCSPSVNTKEFQDFLNTINLQIKKEDIIFIKASRVHQLEKVLDNFKIQKTQKTKTKIQTKK